MIREMSPLIGRFLGTGTLVAGGMTAALAVATGCSALAWAPSAAAATFTHHLAVDCPPPYSQSCAPHAGIPVTTAGPLYASFTADGNPPACAPGMASIWFNDEPVKAGKLEPGETLEAGKDVRAGTYQVTVHLAGVLGAATPAP